MARDSEKRPRVNGTTLERVDSVLHGNDIPYSGHGGLDPKLNALLDELEERIEEEAQQQRQSEREESEEKSGGFRIISAEEYAKKSRSRPPSEFDGWKGGRR